MIKALLFDFSRVLLFPKEEKYTGKLNDLIAKVSQKLHFHFFDYFVFNAELLAYLENIKDRYDLYIFTTGAIQNELQVRRRVDAVFRKLYSAKKMGLSKKDPNSYKHIAHDLKLKPNEILFIDDALENIEAAQSANLKTIHYISNKQLLHDLEMLLKLYE